MNRLPGAWLVLLLSVGACASASTATHPVPPARCAAVQATPELDPEDPQSLQHWRDGPPILYAMGPDRHDRLRALLANGADPDVCLLGFSVMALAVTSGDLEAVRILLDAGAHPDQPRDSGGGTPLLSALQLGRFDIARLLIERGADVRAVGDGNLTSLYALAGAAVAAATQAEQIALARAILERGVPVDAAMGKPRITALMMAAIRGNRPLVQLLLQNGADPRLEDDKGQTALAFARKKGHADVAEVLTAANSSSPTTPPTEQRKSP